MSARGRRILFFLLLNLSACTSPPSAHTAAPVCPGLERRDHSCAIDIPLKTALAVPDRFQKDELRALAKGADYLKQNPNMVLQIQGHGSDSQAELNGETVAEYARQYLLSLGADDQRLSTLAFGPDSPSAIPRVVLILWSNDPAAVP